MSVAIVTGSAGLIGFETVGFFCNLGVEVVGIDNDMRQVFFGAEASTAWNQQNLVRNYPNNYTHFNIDIGQLLDWKK